MNVVNNVPAHALQPPPFRSGMFQKQKYKNGGIKQSTFPKRVKSVLALKKRPESHRPTLRSNEKKRRM